MSRGIRNRSLLSLHDWTRSELEQILDLAAAFKSGEAIKSGLHRKTLGLYFRKPSTRTRIAYQVAMARLGGQALVLHPRDLHASESLPDTARALGRYLSGVAVRTFDHAEAEALAQYAGVPVINALTDLLHPCEILADLLALRERFGHLDGLKLCYLGDGNNICNTLLQGGATFGMQIAVACPPGFEPDSTVLEQARTDAARSGARITVGHDPAEAAAGADLLYTDVWASMGQEASAEERRRIFQPYQVNAQMMRLARPGALFLHCLPARRGEEVTGDVLDGPQSIAGAASANVLWVQQAVLALLL